MSGRATGLVTLGAAGRVAATTLVARLLECHERIRRFLTIAQRLAEDDATAADRRLAAQSLVRYFDHALPLHIADEELSLAPRLAEWTRTAVDEMTDEHRTMEPLIDSLVCAWQKIADGSEDEAARRETITNVRFLRALMVPHLEHEERDVFPALAQLDAAVQAAIVGEMEARRLDVK